MVKEKSGAPVDPAAESGDVVGDRDNAEEVPTEILGCLSVFMSANRNLLAPSVRLTHIPLCQHPQPSHRNCPLLQARTRVSVSLTSDYQPCPSAGLCKRTCAQHEGSNCNQAEDVNDAVSHLAR